MRKIAHRACAHVTHKHYRHGVAVVVVTGFVISFVMPEIAAVFESMAALFAVYDPFV